MNIELDKEGLKDLLCGTYPSYEQMSHSIVKACGYYTGGFNDKWSWDRSKMENLTEADLYKAYLVCKNSRK